MRERERERERVRENAENPYTGGFLNVLILYLV
jgi:hypothetical protein